MTETVVIVGAGPAGATAAEHLAHKGYGVIVLEKDNPGRDKPCGGGLPLEALRQYPFVKDTILHTTHSIIQRFDERDIIVDLPVYQIEREQFDKMLMERAEAAGAQIFYGEKVTEIDINGNTVHTEGGARYHYNYLIGADGPVSIVGKTIGRVNRNYPLAYAKADCPDLNDSDESYIIMSESIRGGYIWIFPKGTYVNIGIGGDITGRQINEGLKQLEKDYDMTITHKHGWVIPDYDPDAILWSENIALCGDAGSLINCMSGEGIFYAMKSGQELAEIIACERSSEDYPTFAPRLKKIRKFRDTFIAAFDKEPASFYKSLCDQKRAEQIMKFVFADTDRDQTIEVEKLTEEEKLEKYQLLLKNMGD